MRVFSNSTEITGFCEINLVWESRECCVRVPASVCFNYFRELPPVIKNCSYIVFYSTYTMSCSFSFLGGIQCNQQVFRLAECDKDVFGHLSGCGLSKTNLTEVELILLRAGRFNTTPEQREAMGVCSAHRDALGIRWRPLRSCQYPSHTGPQQRYKYRGVVNPKMAQEVQAHYGIVVQTGSRK